MSGEYAMAQAILQAEQALIYAEMEFDYLEKYEAPNKDDQELIESSAQSASL